LISLLDLSFGAAVVDGWSKATLRSLLAPSGLLLLAVALLLHTGLLTLTLPGIVFSYYAAVTAGTLLAWRFHSSRIFLALLALFLAQQAITLFAGTHTLVAGRVAFAAAAFLLPINFVLISLMRERGFTTSSAGPMSLFLFAQSVIVVVLCRVGQESAISSSRGHHAMASVSLSTYAWVAFAGAVVVLLGRFFFLRKPAESALTWSLAAFFLALHFGGVGRIATGYFAASALILAVSIIETSYLLAYHDELTSLPSRRAFNDALLRLQAPYSIAVVDIDHFKRFNDTYGHDTGDQVLQLVASRLARVTGGGQAYRCGGEEFAIVFPGQTTAEVVDHLEQLRDTIESSSFHRRAGDRRQIPRGPDRRNQRSRKRGQTGHAIRELAQTRTPEALSVTVSIGVATATKENVDSAKVIQAADKALYRAKAAGRNRVETASSPRRRTRARTAEIA
jgi:GGDEF domain-containing protein